MSDPLLGDYRPGTTVLHRIPAGAKLLALAVGGVVLALRSPTLGLLALAVALALVALSGLGLRRMLRALRRIAVVVVLLGGFAVWQHGWWRAVESIADLVALVLAATVLTATTSVDELLDTLTRLLRPLRRFGVDPETVALAFSLTLRAIPTTLEIARETRQAAIARGLQRNPRALLTPLVIRVVAQARSTGQALQARGIGED